MKLKIIFLAATVFVGFSNAQILPKIYDSARNPNNDATQALKMAKESGKNILIDVGGDWCIDCRRLDQFLKDNPVIYKDLNNKFIFFKVYVGSEKDNSEFFSQLPRLRWVPSFVLISPVGKITRLVDTRELSVNSSYDKTKFKILIQSNGLK